MSVTQPDVGGDDLSEKKVFTLIFTLNSIVIADEPDFPKNFFAVLTFIGKSYRIDFKKRVSQIGCEDLVIETTEDDFKSKISATPLLIEVVKLIDGEEFNYCKAEVMYSDKLLEERFCIKEVELIQADTTVGTTSICLGIQTEEMRMKRDPCILATHSPSFKELLQTLYAEYCIDPSAVDSSSNCKLDALRCPKTKKHSSEESFQWCKDSRSSLDIPHELTCQELFGSDASKFCGCGKRDPQTCKPVRPYSCGAAKHFPGCWDRHKQPDNMSNDDLKKSVTEIIKNVCREYNVKPCPANSIEPGCTCKLNKCNTNSPRGDSNCKTSSTHDYKNIIKNTYNDSLRNSQKSPAAVPSNIMDICQDRKPEDFDFDAIMRKTTRNFDDNLCNMSFNKQRKPKRVQKEKDNPHLTQIMNQLNGIKDLIKDCCEQDANMQKLKKTRKNRGGRREIRSAPTRTASLVKNPCMNSKTTIEQRKKSRSNRYTYNFGNRNTGIVLGHKHCKDDSPLVPKNMGWLWNINTYGIDKMRPGWRPGAVLKCIKDYLCEYLNPCEKPVCPPKEPFFNFKYEHIDGGPTVPKKPRNCAKIGTLACNLHDKNITTDAVTDSMIDFKNTKQICDEGKDAEKPAKGKKGKKGKGKGKGGKGGKGEKGGADEKVAQEGAATAGQAPQSAPGDDQATNGGVGRCGQVYDECADSCFRLLGPNGTGPCGGGGLGGGQNGGFGGGPGGGGFGGGPGGGGFGGGQGGSSNGVQGGGYGGGQGGGYGGGQSGGFGGGQGGGGQGGGGQGGGGQGVGGQGGGGQGGGGQGGGGQGGGLGGGKGGGVNGGVGGFPNSNRNNGQGGGQGGGPVGGQGGFGGGPGGIGGRPGGSGRGNGGNGGNGGAPGGNGGGPGGNGGGPGGNGGKNGSKLPVRASTAGGPGAIKAQTPKSMLAHSLAK